eukprot:UN22595
MKPNELCEADQPLPDGEITDYDIDNCYVFDVFRWSCGEPSLTLENTYCDENSIHNNWDWYDNMEECMEICVNDDSCNGCTYNCGVPGFTTFDTCTHESSSCGSFVQYLTEHIDPEPCTCPEYWIGDGTCDEDRCNDCVVFYVNGEFDAGDCERDSFTTCSQCVETNRVWEDGQCIPRCNFSDYYPCYTDIDGCREEAYKVCHYEYTCTDCLNVNDLCVWYDDYNDGACVVKDANDYSSSSKVCKEIQYEWYTTSSTGRRKLVIVGSIVLFTGFTISVLCCLLGYCFPQNVGNPDRVSFKQVLS